MTLFLYGLLAIALYVFFSELSCWARLQLDAKKEKKKPDPRPPKLKLIQDTPLPEFTFGPERTRKDLN